MKARLFHVGDRVRSYDGFFGTVTRETTTPAEIPFPEYRHHRINVKIDENHTLIDDKGRNRGTYTEMEAAEHQWSKA